MRNPGDVITDESGQGLRQSGRGRGDDDGFADAHELRKKLARLPAPERRHLVEPVDDALLVGEKEGFILMLKPP